MNLSVTLSKSHFLLLWTRDNKAYLVVIENIQDDVFYSTVYSVLCIGGDQINNRWCEGLWQFSRMSCASGEQSPCPGACLDAEDNSTKTRFRTENFLFNVRIASLRTYCSMFGGRDFAMMFFLVWEKDLPVHIITQHSAAQRVPSTSCPWEST